MTCSHAVAALALLACTTASADEFEGRAHAHWWLDLPHPAWYAGVSIAQSRFTDWSVARSLDDGSYVSAGEDGEDTGVRVFGAVEFGYVGVELGYADLGEASYAARSDGSGSTWAAGAIRESMAVAAYDLSLIGRLPIGETWAVFARVGRFVYRVDGRISGTDQVNGPFSYRASENGDEMLYGGGFEYRMPAWRLIASYQVADTENALVGGSRPPEVASVSLSIARVWGPAR